MWNRLRTEDRKIRRIRTLADAVITHAVNQRDIIHTNSLQEKY